MRTEEQRKEQGISYLERTAKHSFKYGEDQIWSVRNKKSFHGDKWFIIIWNVKEDKIQKVDFGRWASFKEDYKQSIFNFKDPKMQSIKQFKALKEKINEFMETV